MQPLDKPPGILDPLVAGDAIKKSFLDYLDTTHEPRDLTLRVAFRSALKERFRLSRGPFLQAAAPFQASKSISDLVDEEVLSQAFRRLPSDAFPIDRPLYNHQVKAIKKMSKGRNLIVATGTGSGKTECFLFPILNHLLEEDKNGSLGNPGVRAMLLYPMNALANDQMKRFRTILSAFPEVTFGRFIGDTEEKNKDAIVKHRAQMDAEPLPNELISREEMRDKPPHILLTNYAMLEYLLLRPGDTSLFDGPTGRHWKHIVLDEVHLYNGARGAEIAMLLRRVRDRVCASESGSVSFVGTSATLGDGESDAEQVAAFASELFGEPVEYFPGDAARQDVVLPEVDPLVRGEASWSLDESRIEDLHRCIGHETQIDDLDRIIPDSAFSKGERPTIVSEYLWEALSREGHVVKLQERLERGSLEVEALAAELFSGSAPATKLMFLVNLCLKATPAASEAPLLPAKYHFLLRALEGAFLCLSASHPVGQPTFELNRHSHCPSCRSAGVESQMFEYALCRACGASYLVGSLRVDSTDGSGAIKQANPYETELHYLLIDQSVGEEEEDEDEGASVKDADVEMDRDVRSLCTKCGSLTEGSAGGCDCGPALSISVEVAHPTAPDAPLRKCLACSGRSTTGVVRQFRTGQDRPQSVIATSLYQHLPPGTDPEAMHQVGEGRKLISFSDSRQDAAFFASYLDRIYSRSIQRHLIWNVLEGLDDEEGVPRFDDLVPRLKRKAEDSLVLDPDAGMTNLTEVRTWLMREILGVDWRESLEGVGLVEVSVAIPRQVQPPKSLLDLGLEADECMDLVRVLLDSVRRQAAVYLPDGVDIGDPVFSPRNAVNSLRFEQPDYGILSWKPGRGVNGRLDYLSKVFAERGIEEEPVQILSDIWTHWLTAPRSPWRQALQASTGGRQGTTFALKPEWIQFNKYSLDHLPYRCDRCRRIWWRSVSAVCPSYRCQGRLGVADRDEMEKNYYRRLYTGLRPIGLRVREHTGQLNSDHAADLQQKFLDGDINALSCTTTFELGVDVGEVQAILMRNVPPSPANYVQRAGRAGRRSGSTALVVTFAQRRNHDLQYFDNPRKLIDGVVASPIISLENPLIVRRHLHAVAFAAYERLWVDQGGDPHRDVASFFLKGGGDDEASIDHFVAWLRERPEELGSALLRVTPKSLIQELGVNDWSWVDALVEENEQRENHGWLARARDEVRSDIAEITEEIKLLQGQAQQLILNNEDRRATQINRRINAVLRVRDTLTGRRLLDFMAQRVILPKYGFPVDVATLEVSRLGDFESSQVDLSRDLQLAITDYAPGSKTVANGLLWESVGLKIPAGKALLEYKWSICSNCGSFVATRGVEEELCAICDSGETIRSGTFLQPIFGFIGRKCDEKPGEARPQRTVHSQFHFSDYAEPAPNYKEVLGTGTARVRFSRQGLITVLTRGRGFNVCLSCGYAAQQPRKQSRRGNKLAPHERPPGNRGECSSMLVHRELGHQYLTDVVELEISSAREWNAAWSALYALLAATQSIGIAPGDLDGTLRSNGPGNAPSLIIFDTVPGGAGHVRRFVAKLEELVAAAIALVRDCECGEDTSCYACLRNYTNQSQHDELSRGLSLQILEPLI
jgi:ATP-dependent helicase YprA (DUF1998 family)